MREFYKSHKRSVNQLAAFAFVLIIAYVFFKHLFLLIAPFIIAYALSLVLAKPVAYISKKSFISEPIATVFTMIVVLSILGGLAYLVVKMLSQQVISFAVQLPTAYRKSIDLFAEFRDSYNMFFGFFPEEVREFFDKTLITMLPSVTSSIGAFAKNASVSTVTALPKIMLFVIITIIATFFMTKDKQKIKSFFIKQIPNNIYGTYMVLKKGLFEALWGYIKAQMILMCFSGCIAIIGLTILGYQYSLLIGLTIAFFDALPVFGPGFILWPWIAIALLSGEYGFALGLSAIYLTIMLFRQVLEPKVVSSQIGLYPLVTLGSMYVGFKLLGPIGFIVGPVMAITVKTLQTNGLLPNWKA